MKHDQAIDRWYVAFRAVLACNKPGRAWMRKQIFGRELDRSEQMALMLARYITEELDADQQRGTRMRRAEYEAEWSLRFARMCPFAVVPAMELLFTYRKMTARSVGQMKGKVA